MQCKAKTFLHQTLPSIFVFQHDYLPMFQIRSIILLHQPLTKLLSALCKEACKRKREKLNNKDQHTWTYMLIYKQALPVPRRNLCKLFILAQKEMDITERLFFLGLERNRVLTSGN